MSQNYTDGDAGGGGGGGDGESTASYNEARPAFYIGQHDSTRTETLTDMQYGLGDPTAATSNCILQNCRDRASRVLVHFRKAKVEEVYIWKDGSTRLQGL